MSQIIWVPSTTEVYTEAGWMSAERAFKIAPRLLTADLEKRKIFVQNSRGWAKRDFTGEINRMDEGLIKMEFRFAFPIAKTDLLSIVEEPVEPVFKKCPFSGQIINFDVSMGIVFLRSSMAPIKRAEAFLEEAVEFLIDDYEDRNEEPDYDPTDNRNGTPDWWLSKTRW